MRNPKKHLRMGNPAFRLAQGRVADGVTKAIFRAAARRDGGVTVQASRKCRERAP
jgi:hypothetical protein